MVDGHIGVDRVGTGHSVLFHGGPEGNIGDVADVGLDLIRYPGAAGVRVESRIVGVLPDRRRKGAVNGVERRAWGD